MKQEKFYIQGMTCTACSSGIERSLKKKQGIQDIKVDLLNHFAIITFDETLISLDEIFAFIHKLGYTPHKQSLFQKIDQSLLTPTRKIILALLFTSLTLYLSMGSMLWSIPLSPLNNSLLQLFFTLCVMHLGRDFYIRGFQTLFTLHPNMDTLIALGSGSAFAYSLFSLGDLHSLYFESVCVIILFILIGKTIESKAKDNTQNALITLTKLKQNSATKIINNQEIPTILEEIRIGDILKISPQEIIPADGIIIQGYAHIDNSSLSGESIPLSKSQNDLLLSGSLNLNTTFSLQVTKLPKDSNLNQILDLVQNTLISKPPIAKLADKIAQFFVPSILPLATLSAIFWYFFSQNLSLSIQIFCNVLLISCPCALGLATPLALNIATKLASQKGIFFKNAHILELLGKVQIALFDKTGTITQPNLSIHSIHSYSHLSQEELLSICAALQSQSHHIIASSILQYAQTHQITPPPASNIQIIQGMGITGTIQNQTYKIGSAKHFSTTPHRYKEMIEIFIGTTTKEGEQILGCILLQEQIKAQAQACIQQLKQAHITPILLSGDHFSNVQKTAKILEINFISDALPQDKLQVLQSYKDKVCMMVGDGLNDMLTLSNADIGISLGNANQGAIASSNLIILNNNLLNINYAIALSQATIKNIKQNLWWAFGYNLLMIPIACGVLYGLGIMLTPVIASFAMTLSSLSVVLNAQRLRNFTY